jgi:hypothetical protein
MKKEAVSPLVNRIVIAQVVLIVILILSYKIFFS